MSSLATGLNTEGVFEYSKLFAGKSEVVDAQVTLSTGNLKTGSVLGKITSSGKYKLSESAATDGSGVPSAVLALDSDASDDEKSVSVYLSGTFNAEALVFGTGHDASTVEAALRENGVHMYIKQNIKK